MSCPKMSVLISGLTVVLAGCVSSGRQEVYHALPAVPTPRPGYYGPSAPVYQEPLIRSVPVDPVPEAVPAPLPAPEHSPAKPSSKRGAFEPDAGGQLLMASSQRVYRLPPVTDSEEQLTEVRIEGVPPVRWESAQAIMRFNEPGLLPQNLFAQPLIPEPR